MKRCWIVILLCIISSPVCAQVTVDTVRDNNVDTAQFHMTRSPTLALGLSAALPGAGQAYLNQWWKVPIIYGLLGGFFYGAYLQNSSEAF